MKLYIVLLNRTSCLDIEVFFSTDIYLPTYLPACLPVKKHIHSRKSQVNRKDKNKSNMQGLQIFVNQGGLACSCGVAYPEGADKDTYVCSCGKVRN